MQEIENGRFTIIPVELLALVVEKTETGLKHLGAHPDITVEDSLNEVRMAIHAQILHQTETYEGVMRSWKRFEASKEFMEPRELKIHESMWDGFVREKYESDKQSIISGLNKSMFELTEVMLDNNIPLRSLGDSESDVEVKKVSLDEIKNMFDGFGKKE